MLNHSKFSALILTSLIVAACSGGTKQKVLDADETRLEKIGRLFGDESLTFGSNTSAGSSDLTGIAVNSFLWRATLDTISFLPLSQADPFGGVIITDWHTPPETPNTRFKVNVVILGRELRADSLQLSLFKEERDVRGQWNQAQVAQETVNAMENAILNRARELRIASNAQQ